jgi:hypothetical protein
MDSLGKSPQHKVEKKHLTKSELSRKASWSWVIYTDSGVQLSEAKITGLLDQGNWHRSPFHDVKKN